MKFTTILFRQHLGYYFKKHWKIQGKSVSLETSARHVLAAKGIPVFEPNDILQEKPEIQKIEIGNNLTNEISSNQRKSKRNNKICLTYKDHNVLLEGLNQAKLLTNTVEISEGLPKIYTNISTINLEDRIRSIIFYSHIFDSEQYKLPKIKDPERPAWNFPRTYGVTDHRVNTLFINKLIQLIELTSKSEIVKERGVTHNLQFSFPFELDNNLIQFYLRGDTLITSDKPLQPVTNENAKNIDLPNIFPIKHTITLNRENVCNLRNIYPIKLTFKKCHPHTVFIHYNKTEVKNLYEEEVTESQILGRTLLKVFTVAASYAKEKFGHSVKLLPAPVTVQSIQTDGRVFHFGVLQLNTLDLENENVKNIWYHSSPIPLFSECMLVTGQPILEGYNSSIINHLLAFYNNT